MLVSIQNNSWMIHDSRNTYNRLTVYVRFPILGIIRVKPLLFFFVSHCYLERIPVYLFCVPPSDGGSDRGRNKKVSCQVSTVWNIVLVDPSNNFYVYGSGSKSGLGSDALVREDPCPRREKNSCSRGLSSLSPSRVLVTYPETAGRDTLYPRNKQHL